MTRALCFLILCLTLSTATSQTNASWIKVRPGVEFLDGRFTEQGSEVTFVLLRIDLRQNQVRIVDTFHEIGKGNAFAAFSLREVQKKTKASIVVNAGSTASFSLPTPVGLLQIGGRIVNPPNYHAQRGGVFCVTRNQVSIAAISQDKPAPKCVDAVQRGPVLTPGISDATRARRSLVAVDAAGRLLILVTREKATFSGLESFLYKSDPALGIQSALNLDGAVSSGLIVLGEGTNQNTEVGNVDGLIASAIAIYKKQ